MIAIDAANGDRVAPAESCARLLERIAERYAPRGLGAVEIAPTQRRDNLNLRTGQRLRPDVRAKVLVLVRAGETYTVAAGKCGVSQCTVARIANDAGIIRGRGNRNRMSVEIKSRVMKLVSQGWQYAAVARACGLSYSSVCKIANASGISRKVQQR